MSGGSREERWGVKRRHGVIHGHKFSCARSTRNDLLNHIAATSNLNYCDKLSPELQQSLSARP